MRSILLRDDHAATAVEYAFIAGLIGLGIVGSLVTTRQSVSSTYNAASTGMASSVSAAPASPRAAFWSGRTLAGSPVVSVQQTPYVKTVRWTYTDGAIVSQSTSADGRSVSVDDPLTSSMIVLQFNPDGTPQYFGKQTYSDYPKRMSSVESSFAVDFAGHRSFGVDRLSEGSTARRSSEVDQAAG